MSVERKDYGTDDEFLDALLEDESAFAKRSREQARYNIEDVKPRVSLIGPSFQTVRLPLAWQSMDEKYHTMYIAGLLAKVTGAKGVMVMSDSRWLKSEDFCHHFKLSVPRTEEGSKAYYEEYRKILKRYGGEMGNLPRHLWSEAMLVVLKTRTNVRVKTQLYTRGSGTGVMWLPDQIKQDIGSTATYEDRLIPDWWTIPDDDPNFVRMSGVATELLNAMTGTF